MIALRFCAAALALALAVATPAWAAEVYDPARGVLLKGTVVTMDDAGTVVTNGNVLVRGDKIVAIWSGTTPPAGVTVGNAAVIDGGPGALIFPGMINAHSHTAYNMLALWPAPSSHKQTTKGRLTGLEPYGNRYQWTDPNEYGRLVNGPKKALTEAKYLNLAAEVVKYAETKAMLGGETAFQGTPSLSATNLTLVRNIENAAFGRDRISQRGLSIDDTRWTATLDDGLLKDMREGRIDAWIVHLAEGVRDGDRLPGDAFSSRGEFTRLKGLGLLTDMTVFIHATGLEPSDFAEMRAAPTIRTNGTGDGLGAKIVWSPLSNLLLYAKTTKVYHALAAGVVVCLGTDWSPSGSKNLLGELKIADLALRDTRILGADREVVPEFGLVGKTASERLAAERALDRTLVRMVTSNPAKTLRWTAEAGTLAAGKFADVFMIRKPVGSPTNGLPDSVYRSLIDATERDVAFVVINGEPVCGDADLMDLVKPGDFEVVASTRGSFAKAVDVTKTGVSMGDQTYAHIERSLKDGLAALGGDNPPQGGGQAPDTNTYSYFKARFRGSETLSDSAFRNDVLVPGFKEVGGLLNLEKIALDPVLIEDDDFFFYILDGDLAASGLIDDPTPPFKLYPANLNHVVAGGNPYARAAFEDRWFGYVAGGIPSPPPPAVATPAEISSFVNSIPGSAQDQERVLMDEVGLSASAAATVRALVAGGTLTRAALLQQIGLAGTILIERHVADWLILQPPPNPLADEATLLAYLNHPSTTVASLKLAKVTSNVANGLIARRDGPDAKAATPDDRPFRDPDAGGPLTGFDDVDSVPYVGPATLETLRKIAFGFVAPPPPPGPVANVPAVLQFLNAESTTVDVLKKAVADGGPGVSSSAAHAIMNHRNGPDGRFKTTDDNLFDTIKEVDDVYGVGVATMQALEAFAGSPSAPSLVPKLLQLLNLKPGGVYCANQAFLTARVGLTSLQASNLVAARLASPGGVFASVEAVDAVPQIGAVSMQKLTTFADALPNPVSVCP